MPKKSTEKWLNDIQYIYPYKKEDNDNFITYYYYDPYNLNTFNGKVTYEGEGRLKFMDLETDPLIVNKVVDEYPGYGYNILDRPIDEGKKSILRDHFNFPVIRPNEHTNDDFIIKSLGEITKPVTEIKIEPIKSIKLPKTHKSKVTRQCLECFTEIKTYRSKLVKGEGFFCCKACSNIHKKDERVENTCLNCGITYKSINPEFYCCNECETEHET